MEMTNVTKQKGRDESGVVKMERGWNSLAHLGETTWAETRRRVKMNCVTYLPNGSSSRAPSSRSNSLNRQC